MAESKGQSAPKAQDPGANLAEAQQQSHDARTSVPDAPKDYTVDARLDNRTGTDRPPLQAYPAAPQQVDGPDVIHQVEFTKQYLAGAESQVGERLGMFSPGPHGLSDEEVRKGNDNADLSGGQAAPDGESGAPAATVKAAAKAPQGR